MSTPAPTPVPTISNRGMPWRPTTAHFRAVVVSATMMTGAVLFRRADLLVLALPVTIIAFWSVATRPTERVTARHTLADPTLREGEATTWAAHVTAVTGMENVVGVVATGPWLQADPPSGVVSVAVPADAVADQPVTVSMALRSIRWGRRAVGPVAVAATSSWGAFRWVVVDQSRQLTTLPMPAVFDTAAPVMHSNGLVGLSRSGRAGDGSEFASIRPFQVGDRLRRIHWPRSLRAGTLHVTSTWADQDSHVVLVIDATSDLGTSGGIDGAASSLDTTVRAAGAIAEHHLHRGDRVSLRIIGSTGVSRIAAASGRNQLRRVLDTLALISPGVGPRVPLDMPAESITIMLSPMVTSMALERAATFARHGQRVAVIDTLPAHVIDDDDDATTRLAWRIRLLERDRELRAVRELGVPVIAWSGPGSLDQFLRDLTRRASAPRLVQR